MGLLTITQPESYSPIYNDYIYSLQSNFNPPTTPFPPNYRYVADVYINDSFITRTKVFPNVTNYGIFRLDRICQDYISYDYQNIPTISENFNQNCSSIANIKLVFFEEYGSLTTGTTIFTATSITADTLAFYNGAISYLGDLNNNYDPTVFEGSTRVRGPKTFVNYAHRRYLADPISNSLYGGEFMTYAPRTLKMDYTDTYWLNIINPVEYNIYQMVVETYDKNNTLISAYTFDNGYFTPSLTGVSMCNDLISVGVGPLNLNSVAYSFYSAPIIDQDVSYYKVWTLWNDQISSPERSSEIFTINMSNKKFYQKFRFTWLNSLGGFDRFSFEGRNSQNKNVVNSTEYKKLYGDTSGSYISYGSENRSREVIYQNVENTYTVNSQFITESEAYWLNELYTSPVVFLEVSEKLDTWVTTENVGGLLKLIFTEPHNLDDSDLVCIIDCNDSSNNQYSSVTVEDPFSCLVATNYFNSTFGYIFPVGKTPKTLPIIINDKNYTIKQAISPRNISVAINFSLSLDDPKQRGGKSTSLFISP